MRPRIGIGIGEGELRAVMVRRQRVVWHAAVSRAGAEPLDAALVRLLSGAPSRPAARAQAFAAVGPAYAQVRRMDGLPPVADQHVLATIVEQNAERFFLRTGAPLRTAISGMPGGQTWGFAVEEAIVTGIAQACRTLRVSLQGVLPGVVALGRSVAGAGNVSITWADGSVVAHVVLAEHVLQRVSRQRHAGGRPCGSDVVAPLGLHGQDAWRFADAYGAAASDSRDPLLIRPAPLGRAHDRRVLARTIAACALVAVSAVGALVIPGVVAQRRAALASNQVAALRGARAGAMRVIAQSTDVSGALREIQTFRSRRRLVTPLLAEIARSSPESTAFLTLHIDSAGGSFVALARRAADVLESMHGLATLADSRVVGTITREAAGAQQVERVAVRFRLRPPVVGDSATSMARRGRGR